MWLGKIAIIMYLFSIAVLFAGYYANQIFQNPSIDSASFAALDEIANRNNLDQQINASLIFGDFIAALQVLFGIVTGETIATAFSLFPFVDEAVMLMIRLMFTLSSAFLWIYIVANRSI